MPGHESASAVYSGVLRDTPAGAIAVWVTRNGVRRIGGVTSQMIEEGHWDADGHRTLSAALNQLGEYFDRKRRHFDLRLDFSGATDFQRRIFERLMQIPYGRIVSYGDIADEMGEPGAARSVRPWGPTPFRSSFRAIAWSEATAGWGAIPEGYCKRSPSLASRAWTSTGTSREAGSVRSCCGCRFRAGSSEPHPCGQQSYLYRAGSRRRRRLKECRNLVDDRRETIG